MKNTQEELRQTQRELADERNAHARTRRELASTQRELEVTEAARKQLEEAKQVLEDELAETKDQLETMTAERDQVINYFFYQHSVWSWFSRKAMVILKQTQRLFNGNNSKRKTTKLQII